MRQTETQCKDHIDGVKSKMKITGPRVKSQESREKERKREQDERERIRQGAVEYMARARGGPGQHKATYFILADFVHSSTNLPSPHDLGAQLVRIHGVTETSGKFGSDILLQQVGIGHKPAWYSRWADCFSSLITAFLHQDIMVNGEWPEPDYKAAFNVLVCRTIPRLLLPLQENGRRIVPSLVHGNLSAKHIGIRFLDGMPVLFSPCALYAHREYELGASKLAIGGLDTAYVDQYLRIALPSEPINEIHDRITLYGIHFNLRHSILHSRLFRERYVRLSDNGFPVANH